MSVISMTTLFALILQWEISCWSLLGLKGLKNGIQCFGSSKQRSSAFWLFKHWNSVFCLSNKLWVLFFFLTWGVLYFSFSKHWNSVFLLFQTLEFWILAFPDIGIQCFAFRKHSSSRILLFLTLDFSVLAYPNISILDFGVFNIGIHCFGCSKHWSSIF